MIGDMLFMLVRALFSMWLHMDMLLSSTRGCMLLLMVMRLMGHQHQYDDNDMQQSVLQSSMCMCRHIEKSELTTMNIMTPIISNRWPLQGPQAGGFLDCVGEVDDDWDMMFMLL